MVTQKPIDGTITKPRTGRWDRLMWTQWVWGFFWGAFALQAARVAYSLIVEAK